MGLVPMNEGRWLVVDQPPDIAAIVWIRARSRAAEGTRPTRCCCCFCCCWLSGVEKPGTEKNDEVIMLRLKFEMSEHVRGALNPVDSRLSTSLALSAVRRRRTQAGVLYTTGYTTVRIPLW